MKKMKKKIMIFALLFGVMALSLVACKGPVVPPITPGPETGVYYHDASGGKEDLLTLHSGDKFTLSVNDEVKAGTYSLAEDGTLKLSFSSADDADITATHVNDSVTLAYSGVNKTFLKQVVRTVSFNSNQGTTVASATVMNGKTLSRPSSKPALEGKTFIDWYSDSALVAGTAFAFDSEPVIKNITLYAKWVDASTVAEFTVDYDLNYPGATASAPASQETIGGKLYNVPAASREGYTFIGWGVSMYDDASKLAYSVEEGVTVFEESATLYAIWQLSASIGSTPRAPIVDVSPTAIKWKLVQSANAYSYKLEITDPAGNTQTVEQISSSATSYSYTFSQMGDYEIKLTAVGASSSATSEPAVRYYQSKALSKVSLFTVLDNSMLVYNAVKNATNYYITIDCGDESHNHTEINNGNFTSYNFANCEMQDGGIKFTVMATGNGWISSESRVFTYDRSLSKVTNFSLDAATQTVSWNPVAGAAYYMVYVKLGTDAEFAIDNGGKTSYSLKEYDAGEIQISVRPMATGYNSKTSAYYPYTKTNLATPGGISLTGNTISWHPVTNAAGYTVSIGSLTLAAASDATEYTLTPADFATLKAIQGDYNLRVMTNAANSALSSVYSDAAVVTNWMSGELSYSENFVSWKYVLGAAEYQIKVTGTPAATESGVNRAAVTFTQAGINTISVMAFDANGDSLSMYSDWASIGVRVYTVTLKNDDGTSVVKTLHKAAGDLMNNLPRNNDSSITKKGHKLGSWYNAPAGNAGKYTDSRFAGVDDIILYAYWEAKDYTVSLVSGSGTLGSDTAKVFYDSHYALEVPVIAGNLFAGWYSEQNGQGTRYTNESGMSIKSWEPAAENTQEVTFYAYYAQILAFSELSNYCVVGKGSDIELVTSVIIPDEYNGKPVTGIDELNFAYDRLESITIGANVTRIDVSVFNCTNLTNIFVDKNNKDYCSIDGVLYNKNGTQLLCYPQARTTPSISSSTTSIGEYAFRSCINLTEIKIPSHVKTIGEYAFLGCINVTKVTLYKGVESIGENAFYNCSSISKITIPADVTTLGRSPFYGCTSLTTITFAGGSTKTLTMGDYTFSGCPELSSLIFEEGSLVQNIAECAFDNLANLTEITIPASVTTIGDEAFRNCTGLTTVTVEADSQLATIGENIFKYCGGLTTVTFEGTSKLTAIHNTIFRNSKSIEEITLPVGLVTVDAYAFQGCPALEKLTFGASGQFTTIGTDALKGCVNLTEITLPATATNVTADLFADCVKLENIFTTTETAANYKAVDGVLYNGDVSKLVYYPAAKAGAYTLPATVTSIHAHALRDCTIAGVSVAAGNTSFTISGGTLLGDNGTTLILYLAKDATTYEIPAAITTIGNYAFRNCTALQTVTFADNNLLGTVGVYAFQGCTSLTGIAFTKNSELTIGAYAFDGCSELTTLSLPTNLKGIGAYAFNGCVKLTALELPDETEEIDPGTFAGMTGLTSITIPYTVTKIGDSAFKDCTGLTTVIFENTAEKPSQLTTIGNYAFQGCTSLQNATAAPNPITPFTLPDTVTTIGNYAFQGCTGLQSTAANPLTLPNGLETIGNYAFQGCTNDNFTTIAIPGSVASLGNYAFANCTKLTTVTFEAEGSSDVPLTMGTHAFYQCTAMTTVDFEDGSNVGNIGDYAFYGCTTSGSNSFAAINIPGSVKTIGDYAFYGCGTSVSSGPPTWTYSYYGLKTVTLNEGLETIGKYAFSKTRVEGINIPGSVTTIDDYAFAVVDELYTLKTLTFSDSVEAPSKLTTIGNYAFNYCAALTTVEFPASLVSIGDSAFYNCYVYSNNSSSYIGLRGITFKQRQALDPETNQPIQKIDPETNQPMVDGKGNPVYEMTSSLTSIGSKAFYSCAFLAGDLLLPDSLTSLGANAFLGCYRMTGTLTVSSGLKNITSTAFQNCGFSTIIIQEGTESIESKAFYYRRVTTTRITIPASVKSIASDAFSSAVSTTTGDNANGLATLTFASGSMLTTGNIGTNAFSFYDKGPFEVVNLPAGIAISDISSVFGAQVATLTITDENSDYSSHDGVLFDRDGTTLLRCPAAKAGAYEVPAKTTAIAAYAFQGCAAITEVTFEPGSQLTTIGAYAFQNCTKLTGPTVESSVTLFTIPDGVEILGNCAFQGCTALINIAIPDSLTTMGDGVFAQCILEDVRISANHAYFAVSYGALVEKDTNRMICFIKTISGKDIVDDGTTTINAYSFYGRTALTSIFIPASVITIEDSAFQNCTKLTTVTFENTAEKPSQLTTIGNSVFQGCTALVSTSENPLILPEGLTIIGDSAFQGCSTFKTITIPTSVTNIGNSAFYGCGNINTVTFAGTADGTSQLKTIGNSAFYNCSNLTGNLTIPASVTAIGAAAFRGCSGLQNVTFATGSMLTRIGASAFYDCSRLVSIGLSDGTLPAGITSISDYTFYNCKILGRIALHDGITSIGERAFMTCNSLSSIGKFPSGITIIPAYAFYNCSSLSANDISLPNGLESIGSNAFNNAFTGTITIPANVRNISESAFSYSKISGITFANGSQLKILADSTFYQCTSLTTVVFGKESALTSISQNAFSGCKNTGFTNITLPAKVADISKGAFAGCTSLANIYMAENSTELVSDNGILFNRAKDKIVLYPMGKEGTKYTTANGTTEYSYTIPNNVTTIGIGAFYAVQTLTRIILHSGVTTIQSWAFAYTLKKVPANTATKAEAFYEPLVIPYSVTRIDEDAFFEWKSERVIHVQGRTKLEAPSNWAPFWINGTSSPTVVWNVD